MDNIEKTEPDQVIASVRKWVESFVIDLNICPFAKRELVKERIRFSVSTTTSRTRLESDLERELLRLNADDSMETCLLIHPYVLKNFYDFNDFLDRADLIIEKLDFEGVFQIASFHPDYQFAGTEPEDEENYTNKSPYPILHLLREESLTLAIDNYPNADQIPARNIELMNRLGRTHLQKLLRACFV